MPAEYGSAQVWGSKKSNLNHLLNFRYESFGRDATHFSRGGRSVSRGSGRCSGSGRRVMSSAPYNKERFLQAKLDSTPTSFGIITYNCLLCILTTTKLS